MHFWDDQYALFPNYRQWETTAAKSAGSSGVTIVKVKNGQISDISRCCGQTEGQENLELFIKAVLSAGLLLASIYVSS